jgi:hypothetical protein
VSYESYIAWKRLTHNSRRSREQMSPEDQTEWDALGIKRVVRTPETALEEARQAYEALTE